MRRFVVANRKRELEERKVMANIGYKSGLVGSMAFARRRPAFEELFNFPADDNPVNSVERYKNEMIAWANEVNRAERRRKNAKR